MISKSIGVVRGGLIVALALALAMPVRAQEETKPAAKPEAPKVAKVGEAAPAFSLKNLEGKELSLADFKGKIVVLEWFNPDCPVVAGHYDAGTMATTQAKFAGKDVVWLGINSGAPGKQGHGVERNKKAKADWKMANEILMDESGSVGRSYGAKTTPHCYVVDAKGTLVYAGGIDDGGRGKATVNYVEKAVSELLEGKPVSTPESRPYGCSVKYGPASN